MAPAGTLPSDQAAKSRSTPESCSASPRRLSRNLYFFVRSDHCRTTGPGSVLRPRRRSATTSSPTVGMSWISPSRCPRSRSRRPVALLVDLAAARTGHQFLDVVELTALVEDLDDLTGHGVAGHPRGVAQRAGRSARCRVSSPATIASLTFWWMARLGRAHEPRAHVDAVGAESQRGHQAAGVGETTRGDHRDRRAGPPPPGSAPARDVVLAGMAGALEPVDADRRRRRGSAP